MTAEFAGALLDWAYLVWLWAPGMAIAFRLGFRNPMDVLTIGFVVATAIATLTYSVMYLVGAPGYFVEVSRWTVLGLGLASLTAAGRQAIQFLQPVAIAAFMVAGVVVVRNVLRVDGWMLEADQFLNGWIASLLQSGDEGGMFAWTDVVKKGLVLPVLLGMGRDGLLLGAIPPLIFLLVGVATYRLTTVAMGGTPNGTLVVLFWAVVAVWASSSMLWGLAFYQHAHGFVALCVAVIVRLVIEESEREASALPMGFVLFIITFALAQARVESVALGLLLVLPFLWSGAKRKDWRELLARLLATLGGPLGFMVWFTTAGSLPFGFLPMWAVFSLLCGLSLIAALVLFFWPQLSAVATALIPALLLGGLIPFLLPLGGSVNNLERLWANLFVGEGLWGYVWWLALGAVLVSLALPGKTPRQSHLVWLTVVTLLFTVLVKATDGLGDGRWGIIRVGWTDSVNRTLFHALPLVTAVTTSLAYHLTSGSVRTGRTKRRRPRP